MSISAEEKVCYLREAAIVLAKEGFQLDEVHTDRLCILLDGSPLCEVTESGGIAYRNEDINEPERIDAKDKVYEIARAIAEYMRQMETAPVLKADGLEDGYKVLADFNGTVLAGVQSKYGVHFVTWDWAYGHTTELENQLKLYGYNVLHDKTYHDYPSYTGSYGKSLETVQNLLTTNKDFDVVFDIHRDAIADSSYAPTVKIGDEYVSQLMFVIGTD